MKPIAIRLFCILFTGLYIFSVTSPIIIKDEPEEDPDDIIIITHENTASTEPPADVTTEVEDVEEVVEPAKPETPVATYYDVPLDHALQDHIFAICEEYSVDPALIIAMIKKESTFGIDTVGDSGASLGLMQIQPRWNAERMNRLGCPDLLDPYQNITVGVDILAGYLNAGYSLEWSLMAYNGGPTYANKWYSQGVISDYAREVIATSKTLPLEV